MTCFDTCPCQTMKNAFVEKILSIYDFYAAAEMKYFLFEFNVIFFILVTSSEKNFSIMIVLIIIVLNIMFLIATTFVQQQRTQTMSGKS